jgi:glucose-6-phosphate dehydrogenase assembly protein OpcA
MIALWDTTGAEVVRSLGLERRSAGGVTSGIALTLVAIVNEQGVKDAELAAATAAASHPCRLLVVVRPDPARPAPETRLDAEIMVGGRLGPGEAVVLRMYGALTEHADSVVVPLLAPDVPVVTWWHTSAPDWVANDPLGAVAERRITDAATAADPIAALDQRAADYTPGDTDLAWTRTTPWRSLVASALDGASEPVVGATVRAAVSDPSGALLRGWLRSRLALTPDLVDEGPGVQGVELQLRSGETVAIYRNDGGAIVRTRLGDRQSSLPAPQLGDQLAEELRHLDADQIYAAALGAATGSEGLHTRQVGYPSRRQHEGGFEGRAGMPETTIRVSADPGELAQDVAARLLARLKEVQEERGVASLVLTGGRIAQRIYAAMADSPALDAVDWRLVDLWWGDERFLPTDDPERNDTQIRQALLDRLPLDPSRVHPVPASDAPGISDPEAAAAAYAGALTRAAGPGHAELPHFDVLLLSVGEDGHVASVFPQHPSAHAEGPVAGVRGSPKPPPNRVTLTLAAINTADQVWLLASGAEKAGVVGSVLTSSVGPVQLPAAGVQGRERTLWLLDRAAAQDVPVALRSLR